LKILIPIITFGRSGGQRVLSQFANKWIDMGHTVIFLCGSTSDKPYFKTNASIIYYDIRGNLLNLKNTVNINSVNNTKSKLNFIVTKFISKFRVVLNQFAIKKAIESIGNECDVILANHSLTAFPVSLAKTVAIKIYYIQAYEPEGYEINGGLFNKILNLYTKRTYKLKNLIMVVNSPIYYSYKEIKAKKFVLCGIDLITYYPKDIDQLNMNKQIIKIGTIGRVEKFKGTWYVLEAFKMLQKHHQNLRNFELHIAFGDKACEDVSSNINVVYPHGDNNLANFYREMDIIVAAGTAQFGAVHYPVIESMACRTPVITTFYLPSNESNAWLCEPESIESILEQIVNILNDNNLIEKTNNALRDIKQFEWDIVANKMIKIFKA
jgi:glycosyltransferase involved in cell wall biosynthesis